MLEASRMRLRALERLAQDRSLSPKDLAVAQELVARQQALVGYLERRQERKPR